MWWFVFGLNATCGWHWHNCCTCWITAVLLGLHLHAQRVFWGNCQVALIVNKKWAPYVEDTYVDGLGRWASTTLKGNQSRRLIVIAAYRWNRGSERDRSSMVWYQQHAHYCRELIKQGKNIKNTSLVVKLGNFSSTNSQSNILVHLKQVFHLKP